MRPVGPAVRLGIESDHTSFRQALAKTLQAESWIDLVGEFDSEGKVLGGNGTSAIEVLILAIPRSLHVLERALKRLHGSSGGARIVLITGDDGCRLAMGALEAGVVGVLAAEARLEELFQAIRDAQAGKRHLSTRIQSALASRYLEEKILEHTQESLTRREMEVTRLLALGENHHEISRKLFVSTKTIDTHRGNVLRKLHLRNNADLARFAIRNGLIDLAEDH